MGGALAVRFEVKGRHDPPNARNRLRLKVEQSSPIVGSASIATVPKPAQRSKQRRQCGDARACLSGIARRCLRFTRQGRRVRVSVQSHLMRRVIAARRGKEWTYDWAAADLAAQPRGMILRAAVGLMDGTCNAWCGRCAEPRPELGVVPPEPAGVARLTNTCARDFDPRAFSTQVSWTRRSDLLGVFSLSSFIGGPLVFWASASETQPVRSCAGCAACLSCAWLGGDTPKWRGASTGAKPACVEWGDCLHLAGLDRPFWPCAQVLRHPIPSHHVGSCPKMYWESCTTLRGSA